MAETPERPRRRMAGGAAGRLRIFAGWRQGSGPPTARGRPAGARQPFFLEYVSAARRPRLLHLRSCRNDIEIISLSTPHGEHRRLVIDRVAGIEPRVQPRVAEEECLRSPLLLLKRDDQR